MFYVSTKGDYGLTLMLYLARAKRGRFVPISEIAEQEKLPIAYLARIVPRLKKAGLIQSKEGKGGGHRLAGKSENISVLEVLESLEGPMNLVKCLGECHPRACARGQVCCRTRKIWDLFLYDIKEYFKQMTLKDLVNYL